MAAFIRLFTSPYNPFRSMTSIGRSSILKFKDSGSRRYQRPDRLAGHRALDIARSSQVEYDDRQPVVHAQRDRRGVHDLEPLLEHLLVGDPIVAHCIAL